MTSTFGSFMILLLLSVAGFSVVFLVSPPSTMTVESVEYQIRVNPNPVSVSEVPDDAVIVEYEELSEEEKEVVLNTMGDKEDGLTGSYVAEYEYNGGETERPAEVIANADYVVRNTNQYYAVFSTSESVSEQYPTPSKMAEDILLVSSILSLLLAVLFGVKYFVGGSAE